MAVKNMKKMDGTATKLMAIDIPDLLSLSNMNGGKFQNLLVEGVNKIVEKIWNDKHQSKNFDINIQVGNGFEPVNKIFDVFKYSTTTSQELEMNKEETKADIEVLADQNQKIKDFNLMLQGLGAIDQSPSYQDNFKEEKHCGIPRVRFLGTLADWYRLKMKITYLDRFGCNRWLNALLPVINKFIEAIEEDVVDQEFWSKAYELNPTSSQTAANKVFGWICNFFPYVGQERRGQFNTLSGLKTLFAERGKDWKTFQIDETDFTRGIQLSPL